MEPLERLYAPPLFPVHLHQFPARFEHHGFKAGEPLTFDDGARVETHPLNHPGGSTGYRLSHRGRSVCYLSDMEHSEPWPDPALAQFVHDADLMIFDGMFAEADYPGCRGWGHSTWQKGVELARTAGVKALAIFHLHPEHDDDVLRKTEAELKAAMPTAFIARERQSVTFGPAAGDAVADRRRPAKVRAG